MARKIEVVEHRSEWKKIFETEAGLLRDVFGPSLLRIHHIGSTVVPGLMAKPVIDILIEIVAGVDVADFYEGMESLSYDCRGECLDAVVPGTPGRYYFSKTIDGERYSHVHVCHEGHSQITELIALRDFLQMNPSEAKKYGALKAELASRFSFNNIEYMRGKDNFIKRMIRKAMQ